jgi:2-oxoisovalerate dehydrogenase E1 component alpha subunit
LWKKYGDVWAPWRKERKRFVEEGEDVMDCDGRGA